MITLKQSDTNYLVRTEHYSSGYMIGIFKSEERAREIIELSKVLHKLIDDRDFPHYEEDLIKVMLKGEGYDISDSFLEGLLWGGRDWVYYEIPVYE
jgi:hypothetical protein